MAAAGLGGIWNSEAYLARGLTLFAVASRRRTTRHGGDRTDRLWRAPARGSAAADTNGGVRRDLAVLATGPGLHLLRVVVDAHPAWACCDGQKWVAQLSPPGPHTLRCGHGAQRCDAGCDRQRRHCLALVLARCLTWRGGVGARLRLCAAPVRLGGSGSGDQCADPRTVAVLPAGTMRRFSWSGSARYSIRSPLGSRRCADHR